jgi:hypothetical protein
MSLPVIGGTLQWVSFPEKLNESGGGRNHVGKNLQLRCETNRELGITCSGCGDVIHIYCVGSGGHIRIKCILKIP